MDNGAYGLIGGAINAAIGAAEGKANREHQLQMQQNQFDYGIKTMGLQHSYNEAGANAADQRTRALYNDLQSPQAMVEQLKAAGLNPALMYSNMSGGAGGSVPHGAQGQGSGLPGAGGASGNPYFPIDIASAMAQTKLAEAEANKAEAQAQEIRGETPKAQAEIDKLKNEAENIAQNTSNEKVKNGILNLQSKYQDLQNSYLESTLSDAIDEAHWSAQKMFEEWNHQNIWNDIDINAKHTIIKQYDANYNYTLAKIITEKSEQKVNAAEAERLIQMGRLVLSQVATEKIKQTDYGKQWRFKSEELRIAEKRLSTELERAKISRNAIIWASGISAGGNAAGNILRFIGTKGKALPTDQGGNTLGGGLEWIPMIGVD